MKRPWKVPFRKNRKLQSCVVLSLVLHLLLLFGITHRERVTQFPVLLPIMVKFAKQPPPQRTLTRRQRYLQRPLVRRPALQAAPVVAMRPAPSALRPLPVFKSSALRLPTAALPEQQVLPVPDFPVRHIGPHLRAGALEGTRQGADEIDLSLELMDVQALDTGRHRAMVVVDPKDRRNLKGFLYLSSVYSPSIDRAESETSRRLYQTRQLAEKQMLQGLADKMVASTQVHVELHDAVRLDDPQLLQVPFVLLTASAPFEFTETEAANLGAYLIAGGFLFADIVSNLLHDYSDDELDIPALRSLIRASFEAVGYQEWKDWQFTRLELTHPIYHCFYSVESLPRGMRDMHYSIGVPLTPDYLEGIVVGEQLVGIYSMRGYADFWAGTAEREQEDLDVANSPFLTSAEEPLVHNLGVNLVVYALTREGAMTEQLVAVE
ncbi:MAG: DUF4159 domain-containing protein [Gemmatimonadetes bacterium]|nr:DUF4159 domain-containing protein [Gemmatimonadota bacterium]MYB70189.1 DUF4159 domain-containing protein [Gemmatimonadota bacterium]